jgi:serine/threonine-protein kinase
MIIMAEEKTEKYTVLEEMVDTWGRFKLVTLLGKGGMGDVYKAYDPRLERHIALKILRHEDPETLARFLREARSQALVEHRHVCKVYESGEWQGHPYIAMQLIDGQTLKTLGKSLTLEEKLRMIKETALGLQAAHSRGLIHRDVKPDNIMIGHTEEGNLAPFIMDFGIAREQSAPGLTTTGMVMGTPFYLSPEMASGKLDSLDRRCDIYSLGVTMYELLTGAVPFHGTNPVEVLIKVLEKEPQPVRKLNPGVPVDVENIVMKCLEKDPNRRYSSAKELAEDIQRYLDGDPVTARPVTMTYRIKRKLIKNKRSSMVISAAALVIVVLMGLWLQTEHDASRRAVIAQELGQEVEKIENMIHLAHLLPLHNISREKNMIRKRIEGIREKIKQVGKMGLGPGHYAMGRGYIALKEYPKAKTHLEKSMAAGYRNPEVSYDLGRVLGELYLEESEKVNRVQNKELREARIKEIEKTYREPAVRFLLQGTRIQDKSPGYISALISFYEKKYNKALTVLGSAMEKSAQEEPWLYDAKILEGNIYLAIGLENNYYDEKIENFSKAQQAYQDVIKIGESDIRGYMGISRVLERKIKARLDYEGGELQPLVEEAVAQCRKALRIEPGRADVYVTEASVYCRLGRNQVFTGKDPIRAFDKSVAAARQAIKLQNGNFEAYTIAGITYRYKAEYLKDKGQDPVEAYGLAAWNFNKAIQFNPTFVAAYNGMGNVYIRTAQHEMSQGKNPDQSLNKAIATLRKALAINPNLVNLYNGLAGALWVKGGILTGRGQDARPAFMEASQSLEKAIELNPDIMHFYSNLGFIYMDLGRYELNYGFTPADSLSKAGQRFEEAIRINPQAYEHYWGMMDVNGILNRYNYMTGKQGDGGEAFARARLYFKEGVSVKPNFPKFYICMAENYILQAYCQKDGGPVRLNMLEQARDLLETAKTKNPKNADIYLLEGEMFLSRARCMLDNRRDPAPDFRKAEDALNRAKEINPKNIGFHLIGARLHRRLAEWNISRRRPAAAGAELAAGLGHLREALVLNSNCAEAYALKGVLLKLHAKIANDKKTRLADEKEARASLLKGIQINRNLETLYAPFLEQ